MKKCPVCGAECFDDMETCFECLHSFKEDAHAEKTPIEQMTEAAIGSHMLKTEQTAQEAQAELVTCNNFEHSAPQSNNVVSTCGAAQEIDAICGAQEFDTICSTEEQGTQTWVLKLGVPAGCEGVTVRLARA